MSAIMIFMLKLNDPAWLPEYRAEAPALVAKYGGEYLARSTEVQVIEGDAEPPSTAAVLRFPSIEAMRAFLDSEEYRPFKAMRLAGSETVILGFEA